MSERILISKADLAEAADLIAALTRRLPPQSTPGTYTVEVWRLEQRAKTWLKTVAADLERQQKN